MKTILTAFLLLFCFCDLAKGAKHSHLDVFSKIPDDLIELLAKAHKPDQFGAIGRNRKQYIHVRFQYRMHHLADYAVSRRNPDAALYFVRALEYAFDYQKEDGGFEINVPKGLNVKKGLRRGDIASGTAFFLSSAASGIASLEQSDWFQASRDMANLRLRQKKLNKNLRKAGRFLFREKEILFRYDATAPNRLFIDALAFQALGIHLQNPKYTQTADRFLRLALTQQNARGYFIEAGGYDSSYNGVAIAVGYRLLILQPQNRILRDALKKAVRWQESRVSDTGVVRMKGNSRVYVGGETFMGKEKRIDISHLVDGFALASVFIGDNRYLKIARGILGAYANKPK